jgi:hypothetical protein
MKTAEAAEPRFVAHERAAPQVVVHDVQRTPSQPADVRVEHLLLVPKQVCGAREQAHVRESSDLAPRSGKALSMNTRLRRQS